MSKYGGADSYVSGHQDMKKEENPKGSDDDKLIWQMVDTIVLEVDPDNLA